MTIKELLDHSEQALQYIQELRSALDKAREEDPFSVMGSEAAVAQAIPIFLQESQAYSQLAQAKMDYEWFKEPEQST
jgi:hypothetical protein